MDNEKLESKVMGKIKSGQVKLRSRYVFLAEKLGLGSVFVLSVLLAVLFFSLLLFYLRASDNLFYLSFGSLGLFAFLESFPYLLIISLIIFVFVAGIIVKKSDISYQKPFGYLALGLLGFVLMAGTALSVTSVAEKIHRNSFNFPPMDRVFRPFGEAGPRDGQRGIAGRVIEIEDNYILVQTPRQILRVSLNERIEPIPEVGQFIVAVGYRIDGVFNANKIHVVNEQEMQMIRNNVRRQFGPMDSNSANRKNCLGGCPNEASTSSECGIKCFNAIMPTN